MSDLIDRQKAIEEIARWIGYIDEDMVLRIQTGLKKVPSAERKGKWYAIGNTGLATCECGYITDRYSVYNYCPKCGALMKGGEDE